MMSFFSEHSLSESPDPQDEFTTSDDAVLRQVRIEQYGTESLHRQDPQTALLGAITAGMMDIMFRYETAIKEELDGGADLIHENQDLQRAVSTYSNGNRQIERNISLMSRLEDAREGSKHSGAARRAASKKWWPR